MKSGLFLKLFLILLTASVFIVAVMGVGLEFFVYRNFSDYVVQQELDTLGVLVDEFAREYQKDGGWKRFRNNPRHWHDLLMLYFPARPHRFPLPENDVKDFPPDQQASSRSVMGERPRDNDAMPAGHLRSQRPDPPDPFGHMPPRGAPELDPLARRLSLFDADKRIVFGDSVKSGQVFRKILVDQRVVGFLGLKKAPQMTDPTDLAFLSRQFRVFYMIGAFVLLLAVSLSFLLSRHLAAPVRRIAAGTRAVRNRQFDTRIAVVSNDELGQLAQDFNAMAQTLQHYESMRRQWLTDIAHELRTPLAVMRGEIEAIQDGIREFQPQTAESLHAEIMALSRIVNDLSLIAKTESGILEMQREPVHPVRILKEILIRYRPRFDHRDITVRMDFTDSGEATVSGDADRLNQVFANLFENILRYADAPGRLSIRAGQEKTHIKISIEDSGPGVPEDALKRLFDRFYRTDSARTRESGGSGLGLSICKSIIEAHQGQIRAEKGKSGGLRIVMELPCRV